MIRTYSELISIPTFEDRYEYVKLSGEVGVETFGSSRYLNQTFYRSPEWKRARNYVIARDEGYDLAMPDRMIGGRILIHHLNPISEDDVIQHRSNIVDPENLICVSNNTHQAIHYGDDSLLVLSKPIERRQNDTIPWR